MSIEVLINLVWLIAEPPSITHNTDVRSERILVCQGLNDSFVTGLIYPFILILGATLYAFKTRKCPGGFNETKFILFANIITTIHWLAYVPLYLVSTEIEIRAVILAFSLSLSGIVQLTCLLCPKLYTVIFKPEKNTRIAVMKHQRSRLSYGIPETPPNSVNVSHHPGHPCHPEVHLVHSGSQPEFHYPNSQLASSPPSTSSFADLKMSKSVSAPHTASTQTGLTPEEGDVRFPWSPKEADEDDRESGEEESLLHQRVHSLKKGATPKRKRSSSVCRSTQTFLSSDFSNLPITFTVSEASVGTLNGLAAGEDGEESEDSEAKTNSTSRTLLENGRKNSGDKSELKLRSRRRKSSNLSTLSQDAGRERHRSSSVSAADNLLKAPEISVT